LHRSLVENIEEKSVASHNAVQITDFAEDAYSSGFPVSDENADERSDTKDVGLHSSIHTNTTAKSIPDIYLIETKLGLVHGVSFRDFGADVLT
jgi:hypothetical protein